MRFKKNYDIYKKKLLTIVFFIDKYEYIFNDKIFFTIYTNYKSFVNFLILKNMKIFSWNESSNYVFITFDWNILKTKKTSSQTIYHVWFSIIKIVDSINWSKNCIKKWKNTKTIYNDFENLTKMIIKSCWKNCLKKIVNVELMNMKTKQLLKWFKRLFMKKSKLIRHVFFCTMMWKIKWCDRWSMRYN